MSETNCKAKDPRTCRYHGTEIRMNEAAQKGDLETYFVERTTLEKLKAEKYSEESQDVSRLPFKLSFLKNIKGKKTKLIEKLEEEKHQTNFLSDSLQETFKLTNADIISVGPRKQHVYTHWHYGYTPWKRTVYKKTEEGWEPIGTSTYREMDLIHLKNRRPDLTNREVLFYHLLTSIKKRRELDN